MIVRRRVAGPRRSAATSWRSLDVYFSRNVPDEGEVILSYISRPNAVRHTSDRDPIMLGLRTGENEVRFWVRDEGPGIPQGEQQRIFERFSQASRSQSEEGAGLGLSIVKAIAEAHGGRVELHSRPGAGATFTVVLPSGLAKRPY